MSFVARHGIEISEDSNHGFHAMPTAEGTRVPVMFGLDGSVWVGCKQLPPHLAIRAAFHAEPVNDAEWFRLLEQFEDRCKARNAEAAGK